MVSAEPEFADRVRHLLTKVAAGWAWLALPAALGTLGVAAAVAEEILASLPRHVRQDEEADHQAASWAEDEQGNRDSATVALTIVPRDAEQNAEDVGGSAPM